MGCHIFCDACGKHQVPHSAMLERVEIASRNVADLCGDCISGARDALRVWLEAQQMKHGVKP